MAVYHYKILDQSGATKEGQLSAPSESSAKKTLENSVILSLTEVAKAKVSFKERFFKKKVQIEDVINFTRQLKTLIGSSIPLLEAVKAIRSNIENPQFRTILMAIEDGMAQGQSLSQALGAYPDTFIESYTAMVKAGEASGSLGPVLNDLMDFLAWEEALKKKVSGAVRYPVIVIITALLALGFIISFVVPKFAGFFSSSDKALPVITQILLDLNVIITTYWWLFVGVPFLVPFIKRWLRQHPDQQFLVDYYVLKLPTFGALYKKFMVARFSKVFALLYKSGVTVIEALEISEKLFTNQVYKKELSRIIHEITNGVRLSASVQSSDFFQPLPKQLIMIGERGDNVPDMMIEIGNFYSEDLEYVVDNAFAIIQPFLIVIIGGLLCVIALGMFMPMWDAMNVF